MPQLPYEWSHSLNDAYVELKGLRDDLKQEAKVLENDTSRSPKGDARLKELYVLIERVGLGLGPVAYVLYNGDDSIRKIHPELEQLYGEG